MLGECVAVGHTRNVVRHDTRTTGVVRVLRGVGKLVGHNADIGHERLEQFFENDLNPPCHFEFLLVAVEVAMQEGFEALVLFADLVGELDEPRARLANVVYRFRCGRFDVPLRGFDQE